MLKFEFSEEQKKGIPARVITRVERFVNVEVPSVRWKTQAVAPEWDTAWDAAWGAAWIAAWGAAWDAAWGAARGAAWGAVGDAVRGAARDVARDAALYARYLLVSDLKFKDKAKHWKFVKARWDARKKACDLSTRK